jgi:peroxin-7
MIWDARQASPSLILKAHSRELLTADWCKYNDCVIATGSIDKSIKVSNPNALHVLVIGNLHPAERPVLSAQAALCTAFFFSTWQGMLMREHVGT